MSECSSNLVAECSTLVDLLRRRAQYQPEQCAYTFLVDGETQEVSLTYKELDQQARAIGALLQDLGASGERVLLLYPPGLEYIAAFFGCLYAGAIAVPSYPPYLNRPDLRLQAIVADSQATVALVNTLVLALFEAQHRFEQTPSLKALHWIDTGNVSTDLAEKWREPAIDGATLAFLQYTSGSTAIPKGVMVSHSNILYNERMIQEGFGHTEESIVVGWLPIYHDMGLFGNVLQPLYIGARCILMSPLDFMQNPYCWLQAVTRYRAHTSGGPNFGYDLCVRKITPEQRATLDLSSWKVAFNGAEPVRYRTLEQFARVFEPCGFRREAFYPCYGLAEATLFVTGNSKLTPTVLHTVNDIALGRNRVVAASPGDKRSRTLVGCGRTWAEQQIVIADPESLMRRPPNEVGEIWIAGSNVAAGYWNRPEETTIAFQAYLADTREGPFLRTGDLGYLKDGDLFITGRIKDLIIIRGRNHYPQDIELTVEQSHPALRPGCGAAFSVDVDGEERLVVVQEVKQAYVDANTGEVIKAIRTVVVEEHELQAYAVVLVKPTSIPKTSSGKLQRRLCRTNFLAGNLEVIKSDVLDALPVKQPEKSFIHKALMTVNEPSTRCSLLTLYLQEQTARVLRIAPSQVNILESLSSLGLDSLMSVELAHEIMTNLGVELPVADLLLGPSISELATRLLTQLELPPSTQPVSLATIQKPTLAEQPLSHGQRGMWFLHRLAPESAAYHIANAVRIRGELDIQALHRAFQRLVDRHPSLRTTFFALDGDPVQYIHAQAQVFFQVQDASAWSEVVLNQRLNQEANRPFNLEQAPPIRVYLFSRSVHEHILLLVVHHIAADFWSMAILVKELGVAYSAERGGREGELPPLEIEYTDYVHGQMTMLGESRGKHLQAYWVEQLSGELPGLNLSTDRPRPPVQTYCGASQTIKISKELTEKLKALGRSQGATLYMTLLAAFQTLLHRYTGQEDILIGSPTACRNTAELAGLVGYLANPMVLRTKFWGNPSFVTLLHQVRETVLAALAHQDYPFDLLVGQLQLERDISRSPIFQVMLVLQQSPFPEMNELALFALGEAGPQLKLGELSLEPMRLEQQAAQFDLTLVAAEAADGLVGTLQYNSDLFDAVTISRMASHFSILLDGIVADPGQRLSDLPLLTEGERRQLLVDWNDTWADYLSDGCIHELFEAQAARAPEAVAVVFDPQDGSGQDQQVTYGELNRRANQLAHHLRELGVGQEMLVGLCVDRSVEMVIGILGVLKAGGAYVPLDPAYPQERLTFILADTHVAVIVTQQRMLDRFAGLDARVVCVDTDWGTIGRRDGENLSHVATRDNLAYIIYTSGSTGRPKGVAIEHRSVVALIQWANNLFEASSFEGALASTSICFDLSAFELFVPLSCGGKVLLAETVLHLASMPAAATVTLINTVPSAMEELLHLTGVPASVGVINLAGEPLKPPLVQRIYAPGRVHQVFDLYGPSESTTYSTCGLRESRGPMTIGRPIANTQVYVLDRYLNPVPVGVVGELYIGGAGLARGYLRRPELTAERFVPNLFSSEPGRRMYRTGDLVRYLQDGNLEFLGRTDYQVKVRGYRIELGEIEAALSQHPAVREAVVVVWEAGSEPGDAACAAGADKRLVAYVAMKEKQVQVSELRRLLQEKLPSYMLPSAFVILDAFPRTPSGKVDRHALPEPERVRLERPDTYVAPRTPEEETLSNIWSQVLGLTRVGIHDDFFELGGHSLLVTRILSRIRNAFQVELPVASVFKYSTVAKLAGYIETARWATRKPQGSPDMDAKFEVGKV